jgi:hypothetical protein
MPFSLSDSFYGRWNFLLLMVIFPSMATPFVEGTFSLGSKRGHNR